jgi:two-component system, OmpR family, sensor kinase
VGRLFWKFFFFFMLAQMATVIGVSLAFVMRRSDAFTPAVFPPRISSVRLLDAASVTLEHGGESALRILLEDWSRESGPAVYAVNSSGREILGRRVPQVSAAAPLTDRPSDTSATRQVVLANGQSYLFVIAESGLDAPSPLHGPGGPGSGGGAVPLGLPIVPAGVGILASLAVAALLAWYVSKPIRSLRQAFDAAARGDLDARVGDSMGRRRDELADLGRDFDHTAARIKLLMDGQRRLLHDVSHELRSPLARLQAAVGLARQQPGNVETSMDRIERESVRMDRLVDELLTLSRVEAGMGSARKENVDLIELVNEVVQDASFEVDASPVSIAFDMDFSNLDAANITGSAEMLHRALENVVRNAARHTPAGTRVHIAGWRDRARREIHLMIADEGPGVPDSELETIFQPFFRGTAAQGTRGHGLGLAIARRVIEAHGGSISASNESSGGLAVEIRLPG